MTSRAALTTIIPLTPDPAVTLSMRSKTHTTIKLLHLSALTLLLGCAQTNTTNVHLAEDVRIKQPARVLIQDFKVNPTDVKISSSPLSKVETLADSDHEKDARSDITREVNDVLYDELSAQLKDLGYTSIRATQGQMPARDEVMISGTFTNIDEGNAVRRALVGFGAGQSSVDADILIVTPQNRVIASLKAHADSGKTPGAAVTAGVGAAAQAGTAATAAVSVAKGGAKAYKSATATQTSDIADKIGEEFSKVAKLQGWAIK